ncbi:hypothetical protein EPN16_04535 [bacterium]|nr:MAG: hypothetical protein EPN16_04535 [bacterium]
MLRHADSARRSQILRVCVILFSVFCVLFSAAYAFDEKGWNVQKSTHFIVYYKDAGENFVKQVSEKAEECYKSIAENLGFTRYNFWLWDNRAKIYIYNNAEDYQEKTGKPSWSGGVAYYHEKVIETYPWAAGFFQSLLPHELGHIIFREFVGGQSNAPAWLDEGVAMFQEKGKRPDLKQKLLQAIEAKKLIALDKLSQLNIAFVSDKDLVELYYLESLSVVSYLMERFGKDNFVELCHALKERKSFDEAINDAYRVFKNLEELHKAWLRHIKE